MKKKDFLMAAIAGFFTALFLLPVLKNIKILPVGYAVAALIVGLPILWAFVLVIGRILARWLGWIYQFAKFGILGFLNTAIDFGVLNLLSLYTGLTSGFIIGGVNVPGFVIAATNSYFWNKFWVFAKERKEGEKVNYSDFLTFVIVVVSGAVINGGAVVLVSTYVSPLFNFSPGQWLNAAKISATVISLVWNFLGFKFFVFKSREKTPEIPAEEPQQVS